MNLERLQRSIGYRFKQPELLIQALTHRSHGERHYERLEFLGDSVLNCVIAAELYDRFNGLKEGELSRLRANLVRQESLHAVAQTLKLGQCLRLGEGELKSGGATRPSILADALEALLGAVFLDGGFTESQTVVRHLYGAMLAELDPNPGKDPKTLLQELLQAKRIALPKYTVTTINGAAHSQSFEVECLILELSVRTTGTGASRRAAEQEAARSAYEALRK